MHAIIRIKGLGEFKLHDRKQAIRLLRVARRRRLITRLELRKFTKVILASHDQPMNQWGESEIKAFLILEDLLKKLEEPFSKIQSSKSKSRSVAAFYFCLIAAQSAIPKASAASSGFGRVFNPKVFWIISWTCFLSALPYPQIADLTCSGVNSCSGILDSSSESRTTPLAWETVIAVVMLL